MINHKRLTAEQRSEGLNGTLIHSPFSTAYEHLKNENPAIVEVSPSQCPPKWDLNQ
jgi:hypothetical protein